MLYSTNNPPLQCMMTNSTCYKNTTKFNPVGILWHSTGANNPWLARYVQPSPGDKDYQSLLKKIGINDYGNSWNQKYVDAGLNAWIGKLDDGTVTTVQTMPWDYRPWGCASGKNGTCNDTHIQFEICEDSLNDKAYFNKVYAEACELTAYLCKLYNLNPKGTITYHGIQVPVILCHKDSARLGLGSDHVDVEHWFGKYGKTMQNVREDVAALMGKIDASQPAQPTQPANVPTTGKIVKYLVKVTANALNIRSGPGANNAITGQISDKGIYTIIRESNGWGLLKSKAGWIDLEYTSFYKQLEPDEEASSSSDGTEPVATNDTTKLQPVILKGNSVEEKIWNALKEEFGNDYAAAGLMGNLYAESGLIANNLQNSHEKILGYTDASYTLAVDNGSYHNFVKDSAGYGLAQWTYWSRKEKLLNFAKEKNASIGDLGMQILFLIKELKESFNSSVYTPLKTVNSLFDAASLVMLKFEAPYDQSTDKQKQRAAYAKVYYDRYTKGDTNAGTSKITVPSYANSSKVMLGYASQDEYGNDRGGEAGDQTGKEVKVSEWYNHPWTKVYRCTDPVAAEKIAVAMEQACANDNIGYDQGNRLSCWTQAQMNNWDLSKITTKCECDCTSLMAVCLWAAGFEVNKSMTDPEVVLPTNKFVLLTDRKYLQNGDYLKRGDLMDSRNHVAICLTNGAKAEGVTPAPAAPEKLEVIGTAKAKDYMNIRSADNTSGTIYGTISPGTVVEVVEELSSGWYKIVWSKSPTGYAYTSNEDDEYYVYSPYSTNPIPPTPIQQNVKATTAAQSFRSAYAGTYVATDDLNLRNGPSTDDKILVTMPKGQVMKNYGYYTSALGIWLYVQFTYNNIVYTGFVSSSYAKKQ